MSGHDAKCEAEFVVEAGAWTDCGCASRRYRPVYEVYASSQPALTAGSQ